MPRQGRRAARLGGRNGMAAVTVAWGDGQRLIARAGDHQLVLERSAEASETALRAGDLLLWALGACTAGTLLNHTTIQTMPIRHLRVDLQSEKRRAPSRYDDIRVSIAIDGDLTTAQRELILRVARGCTIHHTLQHSPTITVALTTESPDPAPVAESTADHRF